MRRTGFPAIAFLIIVLGIACLMVAGSIARGEQASSASEPTAYPANAALMPGRGAFRLYPWMPGFRLAFKRQVPTRQHAVVFAGDSLFGDWGTLSADFPTLNVANRGIGGDTSRGLLFRFQEDVLDLHPSAIVMLIGTNDLPALRDPGDTLFNIEQMLVLIDRQAKGTPVFVCTLPPRDNPAVPIQPAKLLAVNDGLKRLARTRRSVTVVDLHAAYAQADGSPIATDFLPDRMHFNPQGYALLRQILAQKLEPFASRN
jgi:lysophospholipase L1-like esterase